ncbi:ROK family protein [Alicyclobacillus cycloheptanicus]|uniref:Glucokinase n=1 Tax=Alicyclobacillus cycloheptanicus TaxID=1457 RepID=A0ABT9XHQ9_9BACL|nr:ROK family protein [Alicyclobacillus cycloheptanicus]MDQ0189847.1 glucokinase [Alicyclobacillus cycloheptanicus]WDM02468.1 ROK family protein [Alicyclobacillus cycloheptanicus]
MHVSYVVALDVGGTTIKGAAFTGSRQVAEVRARTYVTKNEPHEVLNRMLSVIRELTDSVQGLGPLAGVGIGLPGLVNAREGVVHAAANLALNNINVKRWMEEKLDVPCLVQGDARVGAIAEHRLGAGNQVPCMLYVAIGTGVGSGMILNRQLYEGCHGFAGEIGHIVMDPGGRVCACGKRGCLETLVSAPAIVQAYRQMAGSGKQRHSAEAIADRARQGDAAALEVYEAAARALSMALANCCTLVDPAVIVIGGGLSLAGPVLFDPIRRYFSIYALPEVRESVQILPAAFGDRSGVVGASILVTEFVANTAGTSGGGAASVTHEPG